MSNENEVTGRAERIVLYTTLLDGGTLFYMIGVAPENELGDYERAFNCVAGSVQFARN